MNGTGKGHRYRQGVEEGVEFVQVNRKWEMIVTLVLGKESGGYQTQPRRP
jgi:hypothetical protein